MTSFTVRFLPFFHSYAAKPQDRQGFRKDGRTHQTKIRTMPGGVGRNIAEALKKLNQNPLLISAVGYDSFGNELLYHFQKSKMDSKGIFISKNSPTAVYSGILTHSGEIFLGIGDMSLHSQISSSLVEKYIDEIRLASIVILDGNLNLETISKVMQICTESKTPVWFEPTEVRKAQKILQVPKPFWPCLTYMSPNSKELLTITQGLSSDEGKKNLINLNLNIESEERRSIFAECFTHFIGLKTIILTLGAEGFLVITRKVKDSDISVQKFPAPVLNNPTELKSVSGTGDCLNAGFISSLLEGQTLEACAIRGSQCAKSSLKSYYNVPLEFSNH